MKRNKRIRHIGEVVVERTKKGDTLHVPQRMHEDGIERFVTSRRYQKVKGDRKELLKEGQEIVLMVADFKQLTSGSRFWALSVIGKDYRWCRKDGDVCKTIATSQIIIPVKVLIQETVNYSFIIKTNTMATKAKKVPAKKTATKKAASKKGEEKGPGKIAQILELHKKGKSNAEIVEAGFNKTTVSIQVSKYKREKEAKKASK